MRIDVWSDVVCPWCYVGSARLSGALRTFEHADEVEVVYRSFELDPSLPRGDAEPAHQMLMRKFRVSAEAAADADANVAALARAEGLAFSADHLTGNTFDVHRVLHLARQRGVQLEALQTLFGACFGNEASIFDSAALATLVGTVGLDADEVRQVLDSDRYADAVRADEREAQEMGISGVPFFLFDNRLYVAGAQSPDVMRQALAAAWEQRTHA
jgi:predicted DsbA family dithiol-disulfide isomerase